MEHHFVVPYNFFFEIFFSKISQNAFFSYHAEQKLTILPLVKFLHLIQIFENGHWKMNWNLWVDLSKYFIVKIESKLPKISIFLNIFLTFCFRKNV